MTGNRRHRPSHLIDDPVARRHTRELDARRREMLRRSHGAPRPPLANFGGILVLVVAVFLLAAQWGLYPPGHTPQVNGLWSLGFAVVSAAAALRILLGQPGRHLPSVILLLGCGVGLLLLSVLSDHVIVGTAIAEGTSGALVLIGGLLALASPATGVDQLPAQRAD